MEMKVCLPLECQDCSLKRAVCLSGEGPVPCDIMIIGQSLGPDEVDKKRIFIGKAGRFLDSILSRAGIDRTKIYLTNTVKGFIKPGFAVPIVAIRKCYPKLEEEIKQVQPKVIVLLGSASYKNFQERAVPGTQYYDRTRNCWFVLTHHPMRPVYSGSIELENDMIDALKRAKTLVNEVPTVLQHPTVSIIKTKEQLQEVLPIILNYLEYGVDCETSGLSIESNKLLTLGLANDDVVMGIIVRADMIPILHQIFSHIQLIGHHTKFDLQFLRKESLYIKNVLFDTMLGHYVLDPRSAHGLKELSLKELGTSFEKDIDYDELYKKEITEETLEMLAERGALDAYLTFKLKRIYAERIEQEGFHDFYYKLLHPISLLLTEMEYNGIQIDLDKLYEVETSLEYQLKSIASDLLREPSIQEFLKKEKLDSLNFRSPKQMQTLLYKYLHIPMDDHKSKTTDRDYLTYVNEELQNPVIEKLLQFRNLTKLRDTYVHGIREALVQSKSGRIHVDYHQTTTITGRLSCSNPNLQTIPKIVGHANDIRQIFVAPKGSSLLEMDFKQLEFRVWAHLSRDRLMIKMIEEGEDIHKLVASAVFSKSKDEVTDEERYLAKYLDFGLIYGRGIKSISQQFKISLDRAQKIKDDFFRAFPEATLWLQQAAEFGLKNRFVKNPFGRKIPIEFNPQDENDTATARRHAVNYPIQGTAADLTNLTGVYTLELVKQEGIDAKILLNVHDSLIWEVREDQVDRLKELALQGVAKVADVMQFRTKLEVDFKVGPDLSVQKEM